MQKIENKLLHKSALATAIVVAIGAGLPTTVNADIYVWGSMKPDLTNYSDIDPGPPPGLTNPLYRTICSESVTDPTLFPAPILFTMLDNFGATLANTSITAKGANQHQTPTCGTLTYDTDPDDNPLTNDGTGSMAIAPFDFFNGSLPAVATGIILNKVPAGLDDGSGNMILANMIFDWDGNNGIPVSISYKAEPLLDEMDGSPLTFTLNSDGTIDTASDLVGDMTGSGGALGEVPASDGTYVGAAVPGTDAGYLLTGPVPMATTEFNTTNVSGCAVSSCMGVNPSADIAASSAVNDTDPNNREFLRGDGFGIGGNPMQDGPFQFKNANFDFTSMRLVSFTDNTKPVATLVGSSTIDLTVGDPAYTGGTATCVDVAPLDGFTYTPVLDTASAALVPISTAAPSTTVLTYECTDDSGNVGTVQRTVNVNAPDAEITLLADSNGGTTNVTHECADTYVDANATCFDPEDGNIVGTADPLPNNLFSLDQSNVDANAGTVGGPYIATWSCQDNDLNSSTKDRNVTVEDTTAPVLTLLGNNPDGLDSSTPTNIVPPYSDPGASITEACDTTLVSPISASTGSVNLIVPDTGPAVVSSVLGYSVTDASGNTTNISRTVNVTRSQPVITLVSTAPTPLNGTYVEAGMNVTDEQDGTFNAITAASSACLGGTSTCTIDASAVVTATAGSYPVLYNVTDQDGNLATQVTRQAIVGAYASNSNFTMLDKQGDSFGGTNDVVFEWDNSDVNPLGDVYTTVDAGSGTSNMSIGSASSEPFSGSVWDAHDVRAFGPGTYSFDSGCTVAELKATGCPAGSASSTGPTISMTVPAGHVGAHMLFDWNNNLNIDVVNVWNASGSGVWADPDGDASPANDLFTGPAGAERPVPGTTWKLVSIDHDGDGFNGSKMVDGPFEGFYANFSAGPTDTRPPDAVVKMTAIDTKLDDATLGSMSWGMLLGLPPLLSFLRRRKKQ